MYNVYNCIDCIDIQFATRHLGLTACWAQELFAVYCIGPDRIMINRLSGCPDIWLLGVTEYRKPALLENRVSSL